MTVDDLLSLWCSRSAVVAGAAAVIRACQRRKIELVVLAEDAAEDIKNDVTTLASRVGIRVCYGGSRVTLGNVAALRRPAAALGIRSLNAAPLGGLFNVTKPLESVDLALWFARSRFDPLEQGLKTGTLRQGLRRPLSLRLPVVETESRAIRGLLEVRELSWIRWFEVSGREDILKNEYPTTWPELEAEMLTVYPDLQADTWLTYYRFNYERLLLQSPDDTRR